MRSNCLPYKSKSGMKPAKMPKPVDCSRCRFKCQDKFNKNSRKEICSAYWALGDYNRQKDFILRNVEIAAPKRIMVIVGNGKPRVNSKKYYLMGSKGRLRVCARFFEKTLSISNRPIIMALSGMNSEGCFAKTDQRGKKAPGNKTKSNTLNLVKQHIVKCHARKTFYVRMSNSRKYLDSKLSILKIYDLYLTFCKEKMSRL